MRITICDDCANDRNRVRNLLIEYAEKNNRDFEYLEYASGEKLISDVYKNVKMDLILLDINMDDMDGLVTAAKIREILPDVPIILITAFMSYALDGYKVRANRFLIKGDLDITLPDCMDDMIEDLSRKDRVMVFDFREGKKRLSLDNIMYIESFGHNAVFHLSDNTYQQNRTLEDIEKELSIYGFVRVHKSYVMNMKYVEKISSYILTMQNGNVIPIPRNRYAEVKQAYARYLGGCL